MSVGKLYGVGIGPGDRELLTLKAYRILTTVPVIAYPTMENGKVLARALVADLISPQQIEIPMPLPFSPEKSSLPYYQAAASQIASHLQQGRDVAVLCLGDPMFYGTFMYIYKLLAPRFPVEVVPGISSIMAAAALLGAPLSYRDDVFSVIPATLQRETIIDRLSRCDGAAIIKLGRHFPKVREILRELGLIDRALYIERATWVNQRVIPIEEVQLSDITYWSLILIPSNSYGKISHCHPQ